jgi:hypothetical protein
MTKGNSGETGTGNRADAQKSVASEGRRFDQHGGTKCEACGNGYDKPIEILKNGISHYFDCFECAIHVMAPQCAHCKVRIIGHGVEAAGSMFCCAHCASKAGVTAIVDRV